MPWKTLPPPPPPRQPRPMRNSYPSRCSTCGMDLDEGDGVVTWDGRYVVTCEGC